MNTRGAKTQQKILGSGALFAPASFPVSPAHGASRERLSFSKYAAVDTSGRRRASWPRLANLKPEQHDMLVHWLANEGIKLEVARQRIAEQFGINVTLKPVFKFYHE